MLNFPSPNRSLIGFPGFPVPSKLNQAFPDFRSAIIKKAVVDPGYYVAKSVILDVADCWGATSYIALRSVEFYFEGTKIDVALADITGYASSEYNSSYVAEKVFITSLSKNGIYTGTQWLCLAGDIINQRCICVFDSAITFDQVVINNSHHNGTQTNTGCKNVKINISLDIITSTVYNEAIPNSTLIFDDQFPIHISSNVEDDQILELI